MDNIIKTGVDELLAYLEGKDKVSLLDVATALKINPSTLQSWVDFLVEEGILGIEYKFTKPFIYLNKTEEEEGNKAGQKVLSYQVFKDEFLKRAKDKQIPESQAITLWKNNLMEALDSKKQFFFQEATNRKLRNIPDLWDNYKTNVLLKL